MLIAVVATLAGFAIEAGFGHQELGFVFACGYALGCIAAVLLVRQSGIFTAVIQPPLLLFMAVPLAYFLLHGSAFNGLKDVAISCGYPLVERFPLMLFTSATVLLIGLVRWYSAISAPAGRQPAAPARSTSGLFAGLAAWVSSAFAGNGAQAPERAGGSGEPAARPRHGIDRRGTAAGSRRARPTRERTPTGSRRSRLDTDAPPRSRRDSPRRRRRDDDRPMDPPRRRTREPRGAAPTAQRETRQRRDYRDDGYRDPSYRDGGYRDEYPPRTARASRFDPYEPDYPRRSQRPRAEDYDPYPARGPRRSPAAGGADTTHHPVSRVRYRRSGPDQDPSDGPPVR